MLTEPNQNRTQEQIILQNTGIKKGKNYKNAGHPCQMKAKLPKTQNLPKNLSYHFLNVQTLVGKQNSVGMNPE